MLTNLALLKPCLFQIHIWTDHRFHSRFESPYLVLI